MADPKRCAFLDRAAKYALGVVSAAALLYALSPKFAQAQQVPVGDARIKTEAVEFASPKAYGKARELFANSTRRR